MEFRSDYQVLHKISDTKSVNWNFPVLLKAPADKVNEVLDEGFMAFVERFRKVGKDDDAYKQGRAKCRVKDKFIPKPEKIDPSRLPQAAVAGPPAPSNDDDDEKDEEKDEYNYFENYEYEYEYEYEY